MFFWLASLALAEDYTSSNFTDHDPVISESGGYSSSTNFQLFSGSGQTVISESTGTAFTARTGFFYFPAVTSPVISATAGDAQVTLTWTAAAGYLGFNVSGYQVGQGTISGGPYSFSSVGNVLASTRASLTNGTPYYFVVRVLDYFSSVIATSSQVSATPVAATPAPSPSPSPSPGGGGGGGPTYPSAQTTVIFSGRAYPKSTVTLLKDAQVAATTVAGPDANFSITLTGLNGGNYIFSVYSEDTGGRRSSLLSFPVGVTAGATTNVSGIFIAPTIATDKSEVKKGDNVAIFGQSVPTAEILISVNSDNEYFAKTKSDKQGVYLYNFDTSPLEYGQHFTKSKSAISGEISSYGQTAAFLVGNKRSVAAKAPANCPAKADLNSDCHTNLIDFSIAAYWYKRKISPAFAEIEKAKLNGDGKVDLVDFSIMAYYWTG